MSANWDTLQTDILIVGAGLAGSRAAIEAHDFGARVIMVTQGPLAVAGSSFHPMRLGWGKGYTAGLGINGESDTPQVHLENILHAGQGLTDERLARVLVEEAPARFRDLERYGIVLTPMSRRMALDRPDHGGGVMGVLALDPDNLRASFRRQITSRNIVVRERTQVIALLGERGRCDGAVLTDNRGNVTIVAARAVILAAGGPNDLFLHNLNTPDLNGACHVMALDLGAELINVEFFQVILGITQHPHSVFPEALLGLHPQILNGNGETFLHHHFANPEEVLDARAQTGPFSWDSLGSRFDLVLADELRAGRGTASHGIAIDFRGIASLRVPQTIAHKWLEWAAKNGVDLRARPVEIAPHAHACNGGIRINAACETGVANLYACGENIGGPHGANRIGGNQFSASQVFGARAGRSAVAHIEESAACEPDREQIQAQVNRVRDLQNRGARGIPAMGIRQRLQDAMWRYAMLDRRDAGLRTAQAKLQEIAETQLPCIGFRSPGEFLIALGLPRAIRMAQIILQVALTRQESRGPHYRADCAFKDDTDFSKPIIVHRAETPAGFACQLAEDGWNTDR